LHRSVEAPSKRLPSFTKVLLRFTLGCYEPLLRDFGADRFQIMSCRIICAHTYPILLEQLLDDVRITARDAPLSNCWILVPTSSLASRLRVQLSRWVERSEPLGGVRILSLSRMVNRMAASVFGSRAPRWSLQLDLLLYEMIGRLPETSPLGRIRADGCGLVAVKRTLLDLAEGGFGREEAEVLQEVIRSEPMEETERELLRFHLAWLEVLETAGYEWQPRQARALSRWIKSAPIEQVHAAVGSRPSDAWPLWLYGFYDLTDSNLQIVASLSSRLGVKIYLPFTRRDRDTHPTYTFTESVLEDLCFRMQTEVVETDAAAAAGRSAMTSVFLESFPEGEIGEVPASFTFQFASGLRAEMIAAVVRVKRWIDEGCAPEDILVIAPDIGKYYSTARELFNLFGIPLRVLDLPAGRTGTGRIVQLVERLWWDGGSPEWVLSMLRDRPEVLAGLGVELNEFEEKIRKLPLHGGKSWEGLVRMFSTGPGEAGGLRSIEFSDPEKELIRQIARQCGSPPPRMMTPSQAIRRLRGIPDWLVDPVQLQPLVDRLEEVGRLRGDVEFPWEILRTAFRELFENTVSDSLNRSGVILGSLMRIRGMTARCAVLLGLSGTEFLSGIEEDPLLADAAREKILRIVGELGHRLPLKTRSSEEMTLLFMLLNTCADNLHWVIPETDEQGKSTAPTPFIQRYLNAWKGDGLFSANESRIARSPAEQASLLLSLDSGEGCFIPPELLRLIPEFKTFLEPPGTLEVDPGWEYAGLPIRIRPEFSVTDLELLARCPFRFWAERILRVSLLEGLEFDCGIDSSLWGKLVHRFLEKLFRPFLGGKITGSTGGANGIDAERVRSLAVAALDDELTGWRLMPDFKQADLRRRLEALAEAVLYEDASGGGSAVVLELEYRADRLFPSIPGVSLKGVIDRIDRDENGIRIVDYKSGKSPSRTELEREVHALFRLQPLLYSWLVAWRMKTAPARFQFLFLGEDPLKRCQVDSEHDPETVLEILVELALRGEFPPTSNQDYTRADLGRLQPCRWCLMTALCRRNDPERRLLEPPWEFSRRRYRLLEKLKETPGGKGAG